jgi:hypothetical protein
MGCSAVKRPSTIPNSSKSYSIWPSKRTPLGAEFKRNGAAIAGRLGLMTG